MRLRVCWLVSVVAMAPQEFSWCARLLQVDCGSVPTVAAAERRRKLRYSADIDFDAVFGGPDWLRSPGFLLLSA
jgi:hypothetical protein